MNACAFYSRTPAVSFALTACRGDPKRSASWRREVLPVCPRCHRALAEAGDEEGSIPYDAEVEMIIQSEAVAGMSGGPAIDEGGRLVGILVRATDVHDCVQYVRVVRMSYIVSRLAAGLEGIDSQTRQAVQGYLEPE